MSLIAEFIDSQGEITVFRACQGVVQKHVGPRQSASAPIDLVSFARSKNIELRWAESLSHEGMIERSADGKACITLRRGMNRRRERFTLAHELGHWILQEEMLGTLNEQLFRGVSRNRSEVREEEDLANLLAAELLVPACAVAECFDVSKPLRSLELICRNHAVSRMAAVRRVADLVGRNFALIQITPFSLNNLDSRAQVDDAIFATSQQGTLFDRDRTRIFGVVSYRSFVENDRLRLVIDSPKGVIDTEFECSHRPTPVPHAFALTSFSAWPSTSIKTRN